MDKVKFLCRLPTVAECNRLVDVVGDCNDRLHFKHMYSWCQDKYVDLVENHAVYGFLLARSFGARTVKRRSTGVGFRPVLQAVSVGVLDVLANGDICSFGSLQTNGNPLNLPEKPFNPLMGGDVVQYKGGDVIEFGDLSAKNGTPISWIKCDDLLIADRVLLCNVSWDDLNQHKLVFGKLVELMADLNVSQKPSLESMVVAANVAVNKKSDSHSSISVNNKKFETEK